MIENIEKFFLNTILKITIAGVLLILVANVLFFHEDSLSIIISASILSAGILAYLLRNQYPTIAVIIITSIGLLAMGYQRLTIPNTSTPLSVVLIIGFIFSVMLKGRIMWVMHTLAFIIINTVFVLHVEEAITASVTYSTLYFILAFATGVMKSSYDKIHQNLRDTNMELHENANEIAAQNEELIQIQENLSALNTDLEKIVNERTEKIQLQNEILIKYSYTNAHHLRGPVARLLGLAEVYKLEPDEDPGFFMAKMVDQVNEIDSVIKQINIDLEANHVEIEREN